MLKAILRSDYQYYQKKLHIKLTPYQYQAVHLAINRFPNSLPDENDSFDFFYNFSSDLSAYESSIEFDRENLCIYCL